MVFASLVGDIPSINCISIGVLKRKVRISIAALQRNPFGILRRFKVANVGGYISDKMRDDAALAPLLNQAAAAEKPMTPIRYHIFSRSKISRDYGHVSTTCCISEPISEQNEQTRQVLYPTRGARQTPGTPFAQKGHLDDATSAAPGPRRIG